MRLPKRSTLKPLAFAASVVAVAGLVHRPERNLTELANRIPEAPPYVTAEAQVVAPPYEEYWKAVDHPAQCQSCHRRIFDEWNGSMMANAWRDPAWRAAFLLSARATSTNGDCDVPAPPDGTPRARHNPFAHASRCVSTFDLGTTKQTLARPGSLLDGFCARCHMPTNYVDNIPLRNVAPDAPSGLPHGRLDSNFDPTSDAGTGLAFATVVGQLRNTESGKAGVSCAVCHSFAETRDTPYHSLARAKEPHNPEYHPVVGSQPGSDVLEVPDPSQPNLGYGVGAGSFRLSPQALALPERLGPLTGGSGQGTDRYLEGVFGTPMPYEQVDSSKHRGRRHVLLARAELCSSCHDVTNPLTIKNRLGRWVGGFPIERTYTEWLSSRYADRPGNAGFDPAFKRDCQTCHMQQDYGQPGTAQTLYQDGAPRPPLRDQLADDGAERPYFAHHFVGGNSYVPEMIGANTTATGAIAPYPELSVFSFSSADHDSPYANAYWTGVSERGPMVQQARLAWERLRNVLELELSGPGDASPGALARLSIRVTNTGSGHKFPTGFPEGRIAWLAVRAFDLGTGRELEIADSVWKRTSRGVGYLTRETTVDPNFPGCDWKLPAGSPDPYALQFKAVASLGDGCPTLDLVYAHPLNLIVNASGQPVDAGGRVVDRDFPQGFVQLRDLDGDGDVYDDSFLRDSRLDPLPLGGASLGVDRYAVVIPKDAAGPVAVTAAVYYQSIEAMVAQKFLGNLADTDMDFRLEPCVLGGACDGRIPSVEPAVVEGAPPVPMEVRNWIVRLGPQPRHDLPTPSLHPVADAIDVRPDVVVKVTFAQPVRGVDAGRFTLADDAGRPVPASVDQIGDRTWALFPQRVFLEPGAAYSVRLGAGVCGMDGECTRAPVVWRFRTGPVAGAGGGGGDTRVALGFAGPTGRAEEPLAVRTAQARGDSVVLTFSQPVMNVTGRTVRVASAPLASDCAAAVPLAGTLSPNDSAEVWTFVPSGGPRPEATYCVTVSTEVYDLAGRALPRPFSAQISRRAEPAAAPRVSHSGSSRSRRQLHDQS